MMSPGWFGEVLGWPRLVRKGRLCWVSDRGTCVSIRSFGSCRVRVTHRLTAEEWFVPCDEVGLRFVLAFDADRPSA